MFAVTLAEIAWRIFYALFAAADAPSLSPPPQQHLCLRRRRVDEILERSIALRKMKSHPNSLRLAPDDWERKQIRAHSDHSESFHSPIILTQVKESTPHSNCKLFRYSMPSSLSQADICQRRRTAEHCAYVRVRPLIICAWIWQHGPWEKQRGREKERRERSGHRHHFKVFSTKF